MEEARTWNADLIVLGSHGYGRFRRMMLGSVAGAVALLTHLVPVQVRTREARSREVVPRCSSPSRPHGA